MNKKIEDIEKRLGKLDEDDIKEIINFETFLNNLYNSKCEYCNLLIGKEKVIAENMQETLYLLRHNNNTYALGTSVALPDIEEEIDIKINYCPMCGRKLGE